MERQIRNQDARVRKWANKQLDVHRFRSSMKTHMFREQMPFAEQRAYDVSLYRQEQLSICHEAGLQIPTSMVFKLQ